MSRFMTVEGSEGMGKSTGINHICRMLDDANIAYIQTREPGGTALGEALRALLLKKDAGFSISIDAELLMLFAARKQHLDSVIIPSLKADIWVICDRFTDASFAYQGAGRGITDTRIQQLADWVQGDIKPDLTFLFDADVETGLARVKKRGLTDRFEQESIDFFNRVRSKYLALAQQEPERFRIIDASQTEKDVKQSLTQYLQDFI